MKKVVLLSLVTTAVLFANEPTTLKDIVVTAQKTEENAQEVPISMNVFNELSLEDKKAESLVDISYFVPNFYLFDPGDWGVFSPSLRGIFSDPLTLSSSVGLYIDGVPTTNSIGFEAILDDIERVEVLRGPQGTLYGKNAEAGVINVITKKPDNNFNGKIGLEYGEDNKQKLNLSLRAPIIKDKLFIGFNTQYYSKDGNIKNTYLNKRANDRKNYYGKIYLRATPTDSLELSLIASKHKRDDGVVSVNSIMAKNHRELLSNIQGFTKNKNDSYAFKLNYDFNFLKLESTTTYSKYIQDALEDSDYSPKTMLHPKHSLEHKNLSQELKLNSEIGDLKWLVGLFASKFKHSGGQTHYSDDPKRQGNFHNDLEEDSFGVFAHLNYAFNDKLNLLGGIRYDRDKSDIDNPAFGYKDSLKSENISPKIAVQYKITPMIMTYASVAKGYKAGGFHMLTAPKYSKKYKSESLINYEIGTKTNFLNNRLMLNAAVYHMSLKDMQMITAVDAYFGHYMQNAPKTKFYGFELDGNFIVNENLSFFGSFGYSEAKFDEFSDFNGNYKNNYKPYAPKFTYSLGSTFRSFGGFYASANLRGYGKMYLDNANTKERKAYTLIDAKIGYEWDKFDLYLYANNLFDKNHDLVGYFGNYVLVQPSSDREIGIKFTYRF